MGKTVKKAAKTAKSKTRTAKRSSGAERVRKHRAKMKAMGLRPVTLWLPDTSTPEFKAEIAREIAIINASEDEKRILEELSEIEIDGWK